MSVMNDLHYGRGYFEDGEGSNYVRYGDDPGWMPTAEVMSSAMGKSRVVYEVGAAKGYFLRAAHEYGMDAWGLDISRWAVRNAPEAVSGYLGVGNATALPWKAETADSVCSWEMLEHVPMAEVGQVLREQFRVLKPGGLMWNRICLHTGNEEHPDEDITHVTVMPEEWWRNLFEALGMDRAEELEKQLDGQFSNRDWAGRFFVYRKEA